MRCATPTPPTDVLLTATLLHAVASLDGRRSERPRFGLRLRREPGAALRGGPRRPRALLLDISGGCARSTERRPPLVAVVVPALPLRSRSCEAPDPAPASLHVFVPARVSELLRSCAPALLRSCRDVVLHAVASLDDRRSVRPRFGLRLRREPGAALRGGPGAPARFCLIFRVVARVLRSDARPLSLLWCPHFRCGRAPARRRTRRPPACTSSFLLGLRCACLRDDP
jgi:hypothetical protein